MVTYGNHGTLHCAWTDTHLAGFSYKCFSAAALSVFMAFPNMNCEIPLPAFMKSVNKYSLVAVNIIFLLAGILLIITGAVVRVINAEYDGLITNRFYTLPTFVIATGVLILLGSVLGFYAAYSRQFYFVAGYLLLLVVVLVFEVSMIIVSYGLSGNAASDIRAPMVESVKMYETRVEVTQMWDDLQMDFECCGAVSRFDYLSNRIPVSCCHIDYGTISPFECNAMNSHTKGCVEALGEWLGYNAFVIAVTSVVVTCLQVPITAVAAWFAWRVKFHDVELET